jgi:hypothetical protein
VIFFFIERKDKQCVFKQRQAVQRDTQKQQKEKRNQQCEARKEEGGKASQLPQHHRPVMEKGGEKAWKAPPPPGSQS